MTLFKIGNNDFTNNIISNTYAVNNETLYNEWTDGNYTSHRDILRSKVSGSFTMQFRKLSEYESFADLLVNNRTAEGYVISTIHCNNTHSVKNCNLFISITSNLGQKDNLVLDYGQISVTIEEA